MDKADFSSVTEVTGYNVTREQISRMYQRYRFAAGFCKDKEVLEVACGSGQGLGYIARVAKKIVGSDIDENNLNFAKKHYQSSENIEIRAFDAQEMPFTDSSFDVVILYEAIYYFSQPGKFIKEAGRVLRKGGVLIICTVNKNWVDFNPSPYSYEYFSAPGLADLLSKGGFGDIKLYGGFKVENKTVKDRVVSFLKRTAVSLHLMPKTMKGKELFKRIFMGKLYAMPAEIKDGVTEYFKPELIPTDQENNSYKVLFSVGSNMK